MVSHEDGEGMAQERMERLLQVANPDLYRANAFRLAQLPVDASPRDVARRQQVIEMALQVGLPVPPGPAAAGDGAPVDADAALQALWRLREPQQRLIDELFWYWPDGGGGDSLAVLHNRAVQAHQRALEGGDSAQAGAPTVGGAAAERRWEEALALWKQVCARDDLASWLAARVAALNDPRLGQRAVAQVCATLPLALLAINAQLAASAALRGDSGEALRQVRLIKAAGLGAKAEAEALRRAAVPICARVKELGEEAAAQAAQDRAAANVVADRFIDSAVQLLAVIDQMLPVDDLSRRMVHDQAASAALTCQVAYGNTTEDWPTSLALLERTLPLAVGQETIARLRQNLDTVRQNVTVDCCWFCGKRPDGSPAEVTMYTDVERRFGFYNGQVGTRITWRNGTVRVPRCKSCQAAHKAASRKEKCAPWLGFAAGIGVSLIGSLIIASPGGKFLMWSICCVLGVILGPAIASTQIRNSVLKGIKPEAAKIRYPQVAQMLENGWAIGARPPDGR